MTACKAIAKLLKLNKILKIVDFRFCRDGSVDEQSDALDDQLTREDIALIEGVWKGINSRGLEGGGHYVINAEQTQQSEAAMHAFHRLCQKLYDKSGI